MLPGEYPSSSRTNYHILFFTIALLGTSIGLYTLKIAGIIYAVGAAVLGIGFLAVGVNVIYKQNNTNARMLLFASMCVIEGDIIFILIFGFGFITFFLIRSQYIFNLDKP